MTPDEFRADCARARIDDWEFDALDAFLSLAERGVIAVAALTWVALLVGVL